MSSGPASTDAQEAGYIVCSRILNPKAKTPLATQGESIYRLAQISPPCNSVRRAADINFNNFGSFLLMNDLMWTTGPWINRIRYEEVFFCSSGNDTFVC
jgi:hypothetical protein